MKHSHGHRTHQFPEFDAFSAREGKSVGHSRGGGNLEVTHLALPTMVTRFSIGLLVVVLVIFVGRLVSLQLINHTAYADRAERNRSQTAVVTPPREIVTDRNGVGVADNVPEFQLIFDSSLLSEEENHESINHVQFPKAIDALIHIPEQGLGYGEGPVVIAQSEDYNQGLIFLSFTAEHAGFRTVVKPKRRYPFRDSLAHIVGYVGKFSPDELKRVQGEDLVYRLDDDVGKTGIERFYDEVLRGTHGVRVIEKDAFGNPLRVVRDDPAEQSGGFTLTIDAELQRTLFSSLKSTVDGVHGSGGVIGVMDIDSGELYSLVDYPSFDNNIFVSRDNDSIKRVLNDQTLPLFSRGIAGQYPSGSIIKPVIALGALNDKIITDKTIVQSTGGIRVGSFFFPDWKEGGHGDVDVYRAISESVNTFFYVIGGGYDRVHGLGVDRIDYYTRLFGLGSPTGIDLLGESSGFIPTPEWKQRVKRDRWYIGDTYHLAIGQGDILVTPVQMLQMMAGVAREGSFPTPHIASTKNIDVHTIPISSPYFVIVKRALRETVISGSARSLSDLPIAVAGKTGTAETDNGRPHSWFLGFVPYDHPKFAFVVLVENGGEGSTVAVPLARSVILELYARYLRGT